MLSELIGEQICSNKQGLNFEIQYNTKQLKR